MIPYKGENVPLAREMRRKMTEEERDLWYHFLQRYPYRFQRQKMLGPFIADFYCHAARLVVEVDGLQHYTEEGLAYDKERTLYLEQFNVRVIRFTNREVKERFPQVCETIDSVVKRRITTISQYGKPEPKPRKNAGIEGEGEKK